ncbi:putative D-cysteine desulfhydrase 1, mitochondrial [Lytechinus variegatus]|uniref:putative D-cysteine desulfhydrase 1, mitochondrial n=1 Tax=Lytechinus variegatus TaxID=7654 RepID=UPI001BB1C492|nr:putative D-cysteine desulfhydrase 1, mitochondrial [Lytechinus variegatus]
MQKSDYPFLPYEPPSWAANLALIPKYKFQLANLNTPIHKWRLPRTPDDFEVFVKRDDMTGSVLSGNKIRKLEFLLADAVDQGCEVILTCGGVRSNHCRATAISSRQLGLDCHLFLWSGTRDLKGQFTGNTLLDRMVGANFYLVPSECSFQNEIYPRMQQLRKHIMETTGKKCYSIPLGGSSSIGVWGYIDCFNELMKQGLHEKFTDIVVASGSTGTVTGLAIGNHLTGNKVKVHGMAVIADAAYFHEEADAILRDLGLQGSDGSSGVKAADIMDIVEGVKGIGYGLSTPEELECIQDVAMTTGLLVDPCYTGKATYHTMKLMKENPGRFKGKKILFIHTGGWFDLFSGVMSSAIDGKSSAENKVYDWMEMTDKLPFDQ